MVLLNTVLVRCASGVIGVSYSFVDFYCLVDLMLLLVWWMWPLGTVIDGGRCLLIRSIAKLGHVANYPLLIAFMRVLLTGINSVVWYHYAISGLVVSDIKYFDNWCFDVGLGCRVVARCTCHMPDVTLWVSYRNNSTFLYCHVCGSECGCTDIIKYLTYRDQCPWLEVG